MNPSLCSNLNLNSAGLSAFGQDFVSHHTMATGNLGSHHFASHYSHQPTPSIYNPTQSSSFNSQKFEQAQFSSLNRYQTHGLHSSFAPSSFHLNLPKSNFDNTIGASLGVQPSAITLMPNDSCNSTGSSGSSSGSNSNSPNSSFSSSPDSKFSFLHTQQSNYLNYLNQVPFSQQNSIQHQLQSNNSSNNIHPSMQHSYTSFNHSCSKPFANQLTNQFNSGMCPYDEDEMRGEDEEDDMSMSHLDLKAMMHYNSTGSEPLPGKTRTSEKYRSVYTEQQRNELECEFMADNYISMKRKAELSQRLALSERQIKIWFQNRRAKSRRIKTRDERKPLDQPIERYC